MTNKIAPAPFYSQSQVDSLIVLPWQLQIFPWLGNNSSNIVGSWQTNANTNVVGGVILNTTSAQNDSIAFNVVLAPGSWSFDIVHWKAADGAIATVALDDGAGTYATLGTVDTYNASNSYNQNSTVTGTVSGSSAIKRSLKLTVATRNASNTTGWKLNLIGINARRTA